MTVPRIYPLIIGIAALVLDLLLYLLGAGERIGFILVLLEVVFALSIFLWMVLYLRELDDRLKQIENK